MITRQRQSEASRRAWADPVKRANRSKAISLAIRRWYQDRAPWQPPTGLEDMYIDLCRKIGKTEARRLVLDHARCKNIELKNIEEARG